MHFLQISGSELSLKLVVKKKIRKGLGQVRSKILFAEKNPGKNISDKLYFLCEIAPYGKSSISIFQECFASVEKFLILGARLGARL